MSGKDNSLHTEGQTGVVPPPRTGNGAIGELPAVDPPDSDSSNSEAGFDHSKPKKGSKAGKNTDQDDELIYFKIPTYMGGTNAVAWLQLVQARLPFKMNKFLNKLSKEDRHYRKVVIPETLELLDYSLYGSIGEALMHPKAQPAYEARRHYEKINAHRAFINNSGIKALLFLETLIQGVNDTATTTAMAELMSLNMTQNSAGTVAGYLTKFRDLRTRLGNDVNNAMYIEILRKGLMSDPEKFPIANSAAAPAFSNHDDLVGEAARSDEAIDNLLEKMDRVIEGRLRGTNNHPKGKGKGNRDSGLLTSENEKKHCDHCNMDGHTIVDCWKHAKEVLERRDQAFEQQGPKGRNRGGRNWRRNNPNNENDPKGKGKDKGMLTEDKGNEGEEGGYSNAALLLIDGQVRDVGLMALEGDGEQDDAAPRRVRKARGQLPPKKAQVGEESDDEMNQRQDAPEEDWEQVPPNEIDELVEGVAELSLKKVKDSMKAQQDAVARRAKAAADPNNEEKCYHTTKEGARCKFDHLPGLLFCKTHARKQLGKSSPMGENEMKFKKGRKFKLGEYALVYHERVSQMPMDLTLPVDAQAQADSALLGEQHTSRCIDAMNLNYVVDTGCSKSALPNEFFAKNAMRPAETTELTSSNGVIRANIYRTQVPMPTLGGVLPHMQKVMTIKGPPCMSTGQVVENNPTLTTFIYAKDWQGFVHGNKAKQINRLVHKAAQAGCVTHTPAENHVPRYYPNGKPSAKERARAEYAAFIAVPENLRRTKIVDRALKVPGGRARIEKVKGAQAIYEEALMIINELEPEKDEGDTIGKTTTEDPGESSLHTEEYPKPTVSKVINNTSFAKSATTIDDDRQDLALAAGEKRARAPDAVAKRPAGTDANMSEPRKQVTVPNTNKGEVTDPMAGIGEMKIINDVEAHAGARHDCDHPHDPNCAACVAGAARAISHRRNPDRVRQEHEWHVDLLGEVHCGISIDAAGNQMHGTHAAVFTYEKNTDITIPMLRKGTSSAETKDNIKVMQTRFDKTPLEMKGLRHDRGPEFVGVMPHMRNEDIHSRPGVSHGATIEGIVNRVSVGARKCRIRAGIPAVLWPLVLITFCFNKSWFAVKDTPYEDAIRGEWKTYPAGSQVLYLPRDSAENRAKKDRFVGYMRKGIFFGPALDMTPKRAYVVLDQDDLFGRGKVRFLIADQVRLVANANNEVVYPFLNASPVESRKALASLQMLIPKTGAKKKPDMALGLFETMSISPFDQDDEDHIEQFNHAHRITVPGAITHDPPAESNMKPNMPTPNAFCSKGACEDTEVLAALASHRGPLSPPPMHEEDVYALDDYDVYEQLPEYCQDLTVDVALVTKLLSRRDPKYHTPQADAARKKEIDGLDADASFGWTTSEGLAQWKEREGSGTWSLPMMLTSEKSAELKLAIEEALLKGRLVMCGNHEFDCYGEDVVDKMRAELQAQGMSVRPVNGTELRTIFIAEAHIAAEEGYELDICIGDEVRAYLKTRRAPDARPRYMLIRRKDLHWVPEQHRPRLEAQLKDSPQGVLVPVLVYVYGDLAAGFFYEARRNTDFATAGAVQRPNTSVFRYRHSTKLLPSGKPAECSLGAFIDDHIPVGHPDACQELVARLTSNRDYGPGFRILQHEAPEVALGLELTLVRTPLYVQLVFSQTAYGVLWVGRFTDMIASKLNKKKLLRKNTPAYAPGRTRHPGADGILGDVARSYISAAMFCARHSIVEMLEPLNHMMTLVGPDWSLTADSALIHTYGYWAMLLDHGDTGLALTIGHEDVRQKKNKYNFYCDSDHASEYARKSTSGAAGIYEGGNHSRALSDCGCKQQPSVARSSGESESGAVDQLAKSIVGLDEPTQLELEMINRCADKAKAAANCCARVGYPVIDLIEWLTKNRTTIVVDTLYLDASVAVSVCTSGESKLLGYIKKTQAVDLLWLRDILRHLGLTPTKIGTERNVADMWTKAISRATLEKLLPLIGRIFSRGGHDGDA